MKIDLIEMIIRVEGNYIRVYEVDRGIYRMDKVYYFFNGSLGVI